MDGQQMGNQTAVICGYYGKENAGDEALLLSLLQMLPKSIHPIVLSANPQATQSQYQVESRPNRSLPHLAQTLNEADWFIWGGGSLIQDVTSWGSPLYYLGLMAWAQTRGLATFAWAQGIGPIHNPLTRQLTRLVLSKCRGVSVRDGASAALLAGWGIPCWQGPDPVWALESVRVPQLSSLRSPKVAVSLRPSPQLTPDRLQLITQALVSFQQATQATLILLPFQPAQDLPLAQLVAQQLLGSHQILILEDPRQLKGALQGVEMLIGMRYHSLIMAAAESCTCFALSYDPKVTQLQQELAIAGWELTELPDQPHLISTTWLEEYANGQPLSNDRLQSLSDRAWLHQQMFLPS